MQILIVEDDRRLRAPVSLTRTTAEPLQRLPIDACTVVRSAVGQGERPARSRGVQFAVEAPAAPVPTQPDQEALPRALLIPMDNAPKYAPAGGSVRPGLSIAKWIVEMRADAIAIQSEPGKGPIFEIRVPIENR